MRAILLAAAVLLTTATSLADAPSSDVIVAIVNKANPTGPLGRDELRPLFQTTKLQWSDGSRVTAYDLPEGDAARDSFNAAVLGLDPDRVARYWIDRKIRGGERPPVKMPAGAVLHAVATNAGAIGYVRRNDVTTDVKVVATIHDGRVEAP
jgi:ABC-type phosphate transport system substrate-binding protein